MAITFPGFQSFYAVDNFLRDFERFFVSLPDGIVSFVATVRGDVSIETISENGECFISDSYKITNVTIINGKKKLNAESNCHMMKWTI